MDLFIWRSFEIVIDKTRHALKATDARLTWLANRPDEDSQYVDHLKKGDSSLARAELDSAVQYFRAIIMIARANIAQHHHHPQSSATEPGMTSDADREVEEIQLTEKYTDHLKEGDSSLARADLDSAEQHFADGLKLVHVRDPTAQQYQREVEPLCKLGDVYSKRGQQTGDGGDFVKAAALYNAAIARSEDQVNGNIEIVIKEVEKAFLKYVLGIHCNVSQDDTEKHKKQLKEMRDQIKLEMETIVQQLDPYVHDEDDPRVKEIEAKRAQAVRQLFEKISKQRKEFISLLVEECIGLMVPPPCKFALIGLGSLATELVTPYSDLEFAILVEEKSEECLVYFRNLTHYLHLKVVNLGETILPSLGIKSLNDFYSENKSDNWYYDSVTPRGLAFDASMPKASKTPLGRQGPMDEPPSELICTPQNMVSKLYKDATLYLEEGYHLATILTNPILLAGDQGLIDMYMGITEGILQEDRCKMARQLAQETLRENISNYGHEETITASLIDVKKDIYRIPAVAVNCLALFSCIEPKAVWETIEEMQSKQVISPNNAHHLTVLTSISAELRLRTYMANGGQNENLSALASIETEQTNDEAQTNAQKPVFHLPNEKQLLRYYCTLIPLKSVLLDLLVQSGKTSSNSFPDFYDNSPKVQGDVYLALCHYMQAIDYYAKALEKFNPEGTDPKKVGLLRTHPEIARSLSLLGLAWRRLGDHRKAISFHEQALQMRRSIYGDDTAHPAIAESLNNLGVAWCALGDYGKAISYLDQALQMYRSIYGRDTAHPHIAWSLCNQGTNCYHMGDYRKAISYLEQALQMYRGSQGQKPHPQISMLLNNLGVASQNLGYYRKAMIFHEEAQMMLRIIYGPNVAHPHIALSLYNQGVNLWHMGDYEKAISCLLQALQMYSRIYGQGTARPEYAAALYSLGAAWDCMGQPEKASNCYDEALQMYRNIQGQDTALPHIAMLLCNQGMNCYHVGDYRKAISYLEQALQICRSIYGQNTTHPDIAMSLSNLGLAWHHLSDDTKAISYFEQALQMYRSVYGQSTANPVIAMSLNNLGSTWGNIGDHRKAVSYHDQALQMRRSIYGQGTAHPDIAGSLNYLGTAWFHLHDNVKAISYLEQALEMYKIVYAQIPEHPDIAGSLNNLGSAWFHLHDNVKAISYLEQALEMYKIVYGQIPENPDIAGSLKNLGSAWYHLCDDTKATSYLEQALQMYGKIYGQGTARPEIAGALDILGAAWDRKGQPEKASISYELALQMYRTIHGPDTALPHIAKLLRNLWLAMVSLRQHEKAISYLEQVQQVHRNIHAQNSSNPETASSHNDLGKIGWYV
ncbi:PREDICTED: uncharacterized protein LOC109487918 [Branchiostoma belcheri]|uniref:Uncharacterized protein LOC109487918 n=1 Tax=Branchiostoma belcheri TaxID=7741 RepID=A0A6P5ACY1_BRABE|nr:PREDICTED: uncharacterized protein LOC109487918 [Branchiostoma belcheri]